MRGLNTLERRFVEEFGNIYEGYGLRRLKGLIVGLLLTRPGPLSLNEIADLLGRSKGPISESIRQLAQSGLVRKVSGPVARRDYYAADPDLFYNNFRFNMRTVQRNLETARRFLGMIEGRDGTVDPAFARNLRHMQAFYSLMEAFYGRFAGEWKKARDEL
jgi:DNA-binding transcriptional regulator GbsR (MarR family)